MSSRRKAKTSNRGAPVRRSGKRGKSGISSPSSSEDDVKLTTQWTCVCSATNWQKRTTCRACKLKRPVDLVQVNKSGGRALCDVCRLSYDDCKCSDVSAHYCKDCFNNLDACSCADGPGRGFAIDICNLCRNPKSDCVCVKWSPGPSEATCWDCNKKFIDCDCGFARCADCTANVRYCGCYGSPLYCNACHFKVCRCDRFAQMAGDNVQQTCSFGVRSYEETPVYHELVEQPPPRLIVNEISEDVMSESVSDDEAVVLPFEIQKHGACRRRISTEIFGVAFAQRQSQWSNALDVNTKCANGVYGVNDVLFRSVLKPLPLPERIYTTVVYTDYVEKIPPIDVLVKFHVEKPYEMSLTWADWPLSSVCQRVLFGRPSEYVIREKPRLTFGASRVAETLAGFCMASASWYVSSLVMKTALYAFAGVTNKMCGWAVIPSAALNPLSLIWSAIASLCVLSSFDCKSQITWRRQEIVADEPRHIKYDVDQERPSQSYKYERADYMQVVWNGYNVIDIRVPVLGSDKRKRVINKDLLQICLNSRVCNPLQTTEVAHRRLCELVNANTTVNYNFTGMITDNQEPFADTVSTAIGILGDLKTPQGVGSINTDTELMKYRSPSLLFQKLASAYLIGAGLLIGLGVARLYGPILVQSLTELLARFQTPVMALPDYRESYLEELRAYRSYWEDVVFRAPNPRSMSGI